MPSIVRKSIIGCWTLFEGIFTCCGLYGRHTYLAFVGRYLTIFIEVILLLLQAILRFVKAIFDIIKNIYSNFRPFIYIFLLLVGLYLLQIYWTPIIEFIISILVPVINLLLNLWCFVSDVLILIARILFMIWNIFVPFIGMILYLIVEIVEAIMDAIFQILGETDLIDVIMSIMQIIMELVSLVLEVIMVLLEAGQDLLVALVKIIGLILEVLLSVIKILLEIFIWLFQVLFAVLEPILKAVVALVGGLFSIFTRRNLLSVEEDLEKVRNANFQGGGRAGESAYVHTLYEGAQELAREQDLEGLSNNLGKISKTLKRYWAGEDPFKLFNPHHGKASHSSKPPGMSEEEFERIEEEWEKESRRNRPRITRPDYAALMFDDPTSPRLHIVEEVEREQHAELETDQERLFVEEFLEVSPRTESTTKPASRSILSFYDEEEEGGEGGERGGENGEESKANARHQSKPHRPPTFSRKRKETHQERSHRVIREELRKAHRRTQQHVKDFARMGESLARNIYRVYLEHRAKYRSSGAEASHQRYVRRMLDGIGAHNVTHAVRMGVGYAREYVKQNLKFESDADLATSISLEDTFIHKFFARYDPNRHERRFWNDYHRQREAQHRSPHHAAHHAKGKRHVFHHEEKEETVKGGSRRLLEAAVLGQNPGEEVRSGSDVPNNRTVPIFSDTDCFGSDPRNPLCLPEIPENLTLCIREIEWPSEITGLEDCAIFIETTKIFSWERLWNAFTWLRYFLALAILRSLTIFLRVAQAVFPIVQKIISILLIQDPDAPLTIVAYFCMIKFLYDIVLIAFLAWLFYLLIWPLVEFVIKTLLSFWNAYEDFQELKQEEERYANDPYELDRVLQFIAPDSEANPWRNDPSSIYESARTKKLANSHMWMEPTGPVRAAYGNGDLEEKIAREKEELESKFESSESGGVGTLDYYTALVDARDVKNDSEAAESRERYVNRLLRKQREADAKYKKKKGLIRSLIGSLVGTEKGPSTCRIGAPIPDSAAQQEMRQAESSMTSRTRAWAIYKRAELSALNAARTSVKYEMAIYELLGTRRDRSRPPPMSAEDLTILSERARGLHPTFGLRHLINLRKQSQEMTEVRALASRIGVFLGARG